MDALIRETLTFLKQEYEPGDSILASSEEVAFFEEKKVPIEAIPKPIDDHMDSLAALISKAAPELKLRTTIPSDDKAKQIGKLWQEQLKAIHVVIIAFGESGPQLQFLQNVAKAIDTLTTPAKLIDGFRFEKERKWNLFFNSSNLKLILAPDITLWKKTELATFYKHNTTTLAHHLGNIPLLFLKPTAHYLKNPPLKKELWKAVCSHLSS